MVTIDSLRAMVRARKQPPYTVAGFWEALSAGLTGPDARLTAECLKVIAAEFRNVGGSWEGLLPGLVQAARHADAKISTAAVALLVRLAESEGHRTVAIDLLLRLVEKGTLADPARTQAMDCLTATPSPKIEKRLAGLAQKGGAHAEALAKNRKLTAPEMVAILDGKPQWHRGEEYVRTGRVHRETLQVPSGMVVWFALHRYALPNKEPVDTPVGKAELAIALVGDIGRRYVAPALAHVTLGGGAAVKWTKGPLGMGEGATLCDGALYETLRARTNRDELDALCNWVQARKQPVAAKKWGVGTLLTFPVFVSDAVRATLHTGVDASGRAVEFVVESCFR